MSVGWRGLGPGVEVLGSERLTTARGRSRGEETNEREHVSRDRAMTRMSTTAQSGISMKNIRVPSCLSCSTKGQALAEVKRNGHRALCLRYLQLYNKSPPPNYIISLVAKGRTGPL